MHSWKYESLQKIQDVYCPSLVSHSTLLCSSGAIQGPQWLSAMTPMYVSWCWNNEKWGDNVVAVTLVSMPVILLYGK